MSRLTQSSAHLWSKCPPARPKPASTGDAAVINAAVSTLIDNPAMDASELVGRSPGAGLEELTADQAQLAGEFVRELRRRGARRTQGTIAGIDNVTADWCADGTVFRADWGWRIRQPQADPALLIAAMLAFEQTREAVTLTLFQPRPFHPAGRWRTWQLSADQFQQWYKWIVERATAATDQRSKAVIGNHCGWCAHRSTCTSLRDACATEFERPPGAGPGERIPATLLAAELDHARTAAVLAASRLAGLEAETEARILSGEWIPEWWLKDGQGNRELTVSPDVASLLLGIDAWRRVPRTPAELERMGADPEKLRTITARRRTGPTLTKITDDDIKRLFSK